MELVKRKQNRLKHFNYSSRSAYFITICVKNRKPILRNNKKELTEIGNTLKKEIENISNYYNNNVEINKYEIMPNHIHFIIVKESNINISRIIQQFKGKITKIINYNIWQKSFYDHIIRNKKDYEEVWKYIDNNLIQWELDSLFIEE